MAVRPKALEQGPKLTDQLGKIVALRTTGETREVDNDQFGKAETLVCEAVFGLEHADALDAIYVPDCLAFGQVVKRQVSEASGEWVIARLIKPGKAYQLDAADIDDATFELMEKQLEAALA